MPKTRDGESIDAQQAISLILSLYVLGALVAEALFKLSHETVAFLDKIDFIICFFFLYDFVTRFIKADSKLRFMKWGWIDLISSIPFWGVFQWARVARIIRILRALRSTKILIAYIFRDKRQGTLVSATLIATLVFIFSSIAILNFEDVPGSNIKTPEDALWWAFTTASTVGYGDHYPVTTEGRVTAVMLIISGIGLIGIYTAFVARLFIAEDQPNEGASIKLLIEEVRLLRLEIEKRNKPENGSSNTLTINERPRDLSEN